METKEIILPVVSTGKCTTTHHACDCVIHRMRNLEKENVELKNKITNIMTEKPVMTMSDLQRYLNDYDNEITSIGRLKERIDEHYAAEIRELRAKLVAHKQAFIRQEPMEMDEAKQFNGDMV